MFAEENVKNFRSDEFNSFDVKQTCKPDRADI